MANTDKSGQSSPQQGQISTLTAGTANFGHSLATGGTGFSDVKFAGNTNAVISSGHYPYHPPRTNIIGDGEEANLKHEVKRVNQEIAFLDWLYGMKLGEYGQFAEDYPVYHRTLSGWREGTYDIPFIKREDIPK
jgi:hypothetical protein